MAAYYATSEVMEAIAGQIRDQLSNYVDDVIIFDGTLQQAVEDNFSQATQGRLNTIIFIGLSDDISELLSGAGLPVRGSLIVDIYALVRSTGRSRYTKDRERLYDVSDALIYTVFDHNNATTDYRARVGAQTYEGRRRGASSDPSLMAHQIRFNFRPRVP